MRNHTILLFSFLILLLGCSDDDGAENGTAFRGRAEFIDTGDPVVNYEITIVGLDLRFANSIPISDKSEFITDENEEFELLFDYNDEIDVFTIAVTFYDENGAFLSSFSYGNGLLCIPEERCDNIDPGRDYELLLRVPNEGN
jgi:hypothetical protein